MNFTEKQADMGLELGKDLADWLCSVQYAVIDNNAESGRIPFFLDEGDRSFKAPQWSIGFAIMGWLGAYETFGIERYKDSAIAAGEYLKSLQIFNPFMKEHYGAIREYSPQSKWCYPRDSISAAWAFLELYRCTGDDEYLQRAELLAKWFVRETLDDDGWPCWGVIFSPIDPAKLKLTISNHLQGCFHGGCLPFFYQLAQETSDSQWTGDFFVTIADYFVDYIQQDDGFFYSIEKATRTVSSRDPQGALHRANDDLGTLGLLCAYRITGDEKYLRAIEKFIKAVFDNQRSDGMFEDSVACIPIILNILHETDGLIDQSSATDEKVALALEALIRSQCKNPVNSRMYGAILEKPNKDVAEILGRSIGYSLIAMMKLFGRGKNLLSATELCNSRRTRQRIDNAEMHGGSRLAKKTVTP